MVEEIRTARLRLVPLEVGHVPLMHALSVDPEVRRYLFEGQIIPVERVEEMIADSQSCFKEHGIGFFAMYVRLPNDPHDGEFAGFCGLRMFENSADMEMRFGMNPEIWGRGFGGEAARAVLKHAFEHCGIEQVIAATDTPNQRSVRVLQRLGMSFRERKEWHGLDTVFYEIHATDFAAL